MTEKNEGRQPPSIETKSSNWYRSFEVNPEKLQSLANDLRKGMAECSDMPHPNFAFVILAGRVGKKEAEKTFDGYEKFGGYPWGYDKTLLESIDRIRIGGAGVSKEIIDKIIVELEEAVKD